MVGASYLWFSSSGIALVAQVVVYSSEAKTLAAGKVWVVALGSAVGLMV